MLDLDILLSYFHSVCKVPVECGENMLSTRGILCEFYTRKLTSAPGNAAYLVTDEFLFCGKIFWKDTGKTVLVGPVTEHPLSADAMTRVEKEIGIGRKNAQELHRVLRELPLVSLSAFLQELSFLNYILNENNSLQPHSSGANSNPSVSPFRETESIFHNTADFEATMLQYIENGQCEKLAALLQDAQINSQNMGYVSTSMLQSLKNVFITSATLACRAAVRGGLDYDRALSLSDEYLRKCEKITSYGEFSTLFQEMLMDLTRRTAELQLHSDCSNLIHSAVQLINGSLYGKITAEQLATELGVSTSYLSHRFKQEIGYTLTDYISRQKIQEAQRLLQRTDLSLAQIAYQLAFSSQSYFHAVFKKVTGITPARFPRKYRA